MRSSEVKEKAHISKAERLNAALALYKAAKDAGTVRRVPIGAQPA
ncbi:hypothetical protein [Pseudomonas sp. F8002]|jgi:hypothetical protein|nr:hypothetical protein [Pseudomonas sp. F8002]